jgi:hypothetical protein
MHPFLSLLFIFFALAASAQNKPQPDYARDWKRADSLAAKGLPKSALEIANRIYKEAKAARNYPQVAKAAIHRMIFRSYSDENAYVELVKSIRADIVDTPEPARSVLQSVLASSYWQYFQQNRYKFYNRSTVGRTTQGRPAVNNVADKPEKAADSTADFTAWDAHQMIDAITTAYLASVREKDLLQKTPISAYDALLNKGDTDARPLRPTLNDLLAHRAIDFFQNTEPDLLKPVFKFELDKPSYLAGPDVFTKQTIQSQDSLSGRYQALLLYQQLLAFHLADTSPDALADADVLRLAFVHRHSVAPKRDSLYKQTLEKQITHYKNNPAEAVYAYQLAQFLTNYGQPVRPLDDGDDLTSDPAPEKPSRWNKKQAADICRDLTKRFPKTLAAKQAAQLLDRLLLPTYSLQVEQVNAPQQAFRALVNYQNVNRILYRIMRLSASEMQTYRDNLGDDDKKKKRFSTWLNYPKVAENSVTLPDDGDLNRHSVEIPLAGLPIGHYMLLATTDDKFQEKTETVQYAPFTVSSLGYVLLTANSPEQVQTIYVTNRLTGEPITNTSVALVNLKTLEPIRNPKPYKTNANGLIKVPVTDMPAQTSFMYLITAGADTLLSTQQYRYDYYGNQNLDQSQTYVKLFTDRAIYRPGQIIYVKGLLYEGQMNQYAVVMNRDVKLELIDHNGERVTQQALKTNEFGTFNTSFTAPVGKLTGTMTIQTPFGSASIRVEEYKRPTFEVKIKPIKQSFKLEQTVSLTAEAKTFSGAVVDGADVRYRIVRKLRERWYWWYVPRSRGTNQSEIANGVAQTDAKGNVVIAFTAVPDRQKARQDNPVFEFEVTIDVTDRAGETRSTTQTLQIGYSALQAELTIPEQVEKDKPAAFPVKITNQSGEKVSAKGQLTVYKLQAPTRPLRNRLWARPDRQLLSREEFERLFPNDLYANENDPRSWPKGEVVQQQTITTPADSLIKPDLNRYAVGDYVAELTVNDSAGETTKERVFFAVVDDKQPIASARTDGWVQARKATVEPGEEAIFLVGTSQPGWVLMTVEENHVIVREEWFKTDGRPRRVTLPVTEKQRGGFGVYFSMVQNGRLYQKSQPITVPFTNKKLTIETQTFRNKLKPGQQEEWTLTIGGLNGVPAEMVATLYDASLDAFDVLNWPTSVYHSYFPTFYGWQSGSFSAQSSSFLIATYHPQSPAPVRQYDQLGWMGYQFAPYGNRPFVRNPAGPIGVSDDAIRVTVRRSGKTISGTMKQKNGTAVEGVNILILGTINGAVSDGKGNFALTADSETNEITLLFSKVGYITSEIAIKQKAISFQLMPDARSLNEVVVVGYGAQKRMEAAGGAIRAMAAPAAAPMADGFAPGEALAKEAAIDEAPKKQTELINPRKNFNETAFFIPEIKTDAQGRVVLKFTMPEALTRWRLLAFAHTKDLKIGTLEREIVTQKELMITANAPRFLREGDTIRVTARINNLTDKAMPVLANLSLSDALTGEPIDQKLVRTSLQTSATVAAGQGQAVGWTLVIPAGLETVTCRLTAQSGTFTDGEEFTVPVLPNRMLVTDTQPFWVNGRETKEFKLKGLTNLNP